MKQILNLQHVHFFLYMIIFIDGMIYMYKFLVALQGKLDDLFSSLSSILSCPGLTGYC